LDTWKYTNALYMVNRHYAYRPLHRKCRNLNFKTNVQYCAYNNNEKLTGPHAGLGFDTETFSYGD